MEAETSTTEARDLDVWLRQDLVLATTDRDKVATLVRQALEEAEYRDVEQNTATHVVEILARFGNKLRAFMSGLLPFGKHIPWGTKFQLREENPVTHDEAATE